MDKTQALQNLFNGTASEDEINLLKHGLASGEISIGGNVNQSVIILGSGNTVELPPAALDILSGRSLLGDLDRDLTWDEIAAGLNRLESELPLRAPVLLTQFQEQTRRLRPSLKINSKSLSDDARREHIKALAQINSLCMEALDIAFNALCLSEEPPDYDSRSPFRGLESFRPEDSEFFFGREALTKKLVAKIQSHPFLAVLGTSGSGKSSLVMAGLIPALGSDYVIFRPGTNPLGALEASKEKSLIVVDQFEELFTLTRDEATRKEFIAKLLETTKKSKVVITLRSDFLGEATTYRVLIEEIQSHLEIVPPMDMSELRRAMEGQASQVGLRFEADLSQQILDDVEGEPGATPILQQALWELWNRRHGRWLRVSDYRTFGGVKQAITSTAEKIYGGCTKTEQEQMRDIFLRLTRLDDSSEGRDTRRRVAMNDLIPLRRDTASITLLLDKLVNARLIVKTVNEEKTEIEVAHEALIRHWERLRIWLNEDRDNLRLIESVSEAARQWERAGRDNTWLNHRGARLDSALMLSEDSRYALTEIENWYLKSCVAAQKKEKGLRNIFNRKGEKSSGEEQNKPVIRKKLLKIFLCHSSKDKNKVRELYRRLIQDKYDAWLDEEKLIGGQEWEIEIPNAVRSSDVVIVCLSKDSINKQGYVQKEIKVALDVADLQPEGSIYIIPLRLEGCDVPHRLQKWQWVDFFEARGYEKLLRALEERNKQLKNPFR